MHNHDCGRLPRRAFLSDLDTYRGLRDLLDRGLVTPDRLEPATGPLPLTRSSWVSARAVGLWAIVLLLSGTYETLADYAMFALWVFYGLTVLAVMILRRKVLVPRRPGEEHGHVHGRHARGDVPHDVRRGIVPADVDRRQSLPAQHEPRDRAGDRLAAGRAVLRGHRRDFK